MSHQRHLRSVSLFALLGLTLVGCAGSGMECGGVDCAPHEAAIPAELSMDGGKPTYSVDIKVPPGRNGMSPAISIAYDATWGSSALGFGWSLQAYSSIFRCPATVLRDGYEAGVRYEPTDRLCMDGEQLALVSGQYGHSEATYRTQVDTFVQVREVGDMDDPAAYFVATYRDGIKRFYKDVQIHRDVKIPVSWYLSYTEDTARNVIAYHYDRSSPGVLLLSEVRYTGRDGTDGLEPGTRWVRFDYESRPDIMGTYLAGGHGFFDKRLKTIRTGLDRQEGRSLKPEEVLRYELSYIQSPVTGRSLITSLRECTQGAHGGLRCLSPTTFDWTGLPVKYQDPVTYGISEPPDVAAEWHAGLPPVEQPPYTVSHDYDADGRDDILFYRDGAAPHLYTVDIHGKLVHDVDLSRYVPAPASQWVQAMGWDIRNNGGADVIGDLDGALSVATWQGDGIGAAVPSAIPYGDDLLIGDYDGSSQADVVESRIEGHDYVVSIYLNHGSTPEKLIYGEPIEVLRLPVPTDSSAGGAYRLSTVGDLDGNGAVDALVMQGGMIRKIIFFYQRADGSLRFQAVDPSAYGISDRVQRSGIHFADINRDGLKDMVYLDDVGRSAYTWRYQVNTGDGFAPPVDTGIVYEHPSIARTSVVTADIYVDGRDELVFPDELLVPYCLPVRPAQGADDGYECSDTGLERDAPQSDFGIYRFAALKFDMAPDGSLIPASVTDTGIVGQANLLSTGDPQGDDIPAFLSPFSAWFSNGRFRDKSGKLVPCPEGYGCGLRVASSSAASRDDRRDAAPDMLAKVEHGDGRWESWQYYPLSNPVRALYSVPRIDSKDRFIDPYNYFFTSSMYVAGEETWHDGGDQTAKMAYGGGVYGTDNMAFQGFRWMIEDHPGDNIRYVSWYEQAFPYWGQLRSAWTDPESASDDDYLHGVPSARYLNYTVYGLDCQGPPGTKYSERAHCVDSGTPTYYARRRSMTTFTRNVATGAKETSAYELYDYDLFGHKMRSTVRNKDGSTTVTEQRYAVPSDDDWWADKVEEKQTEVPIGQYSESTQDDHDDEEADKPDISDTTFDYDAMHFLKSKTRTGTGYTERAVDTYTYYLDTGSPWFGNKKTETREYMLEDGTVVPGYVRTFEYTPDGYFVSSMEESASGKTLYVYDPKTGNLLSLIPPDGKTETYTYDEFGDKR